MLVVLGLVPGTSELLENLENLEHVLHDGHLAHSAAHELASVDEICGSDADEHGCTPLAHDCGCCVSMAGLPDLSPAHPGRLARGRRERAGRVPL